MRRKSFRITGNNLHSDFDFVSAAGRGDIVAVRNGVRKGIDINKTKMQSATANYYAIAHQQVEIVKFLLSNGADPNVGLNKAISLQNFEITEMLLQQGASVSRIQQGENKTALEIANLTGNAKMFKLVFKYHKN